MYRSGIPEIEGPLEQTVERAVLVGEEKIWGMVEKRIWVWDTGCLRFRVTSGTICVCVCVCVPIALCLDYIQQVKGKLLTLRQVLILKYEGQEKKRNILLMVDDVNIIPPFSELFTMYTNFPAA